MRGAGRDRWKGGSVGREGMEASLQASGESSAKGGYKRKKGSSIELLFVGLFHSPR